MASLAAQAQIAQAALAAYFNGTGGKTIVDDGNPEANRMGMAASQAQAAVMQKKLMDLGLGAQSTPEHWLKKGQEVAKNGSIRYIRCDGCAALVLYTLTENTAFKASLHLVEQGAAGSTGHWFVVAGHPGANPTFPNGFAAGSFVIDLWATVVRNARGDGNHTSAVLSPASCVFNVGGTNALRVRQSWGGEQMVLP